MKATSKDPGGDGPWAVTADGVRRMYSSGKGGGFEAVRGIDLKVGRGEMFALLGTNGAGKTSLVELLEGLAPPSEGTIRVLGHDPYAERAVVRPRIGVLLQSGGFPSDLTVAETARMWAAATTGARPPGEVLELLGLGRRLGVKSTGGCSLPRRPGGWLAWPLRTGRRAHRHRRTALRRKGICSCR